MYVSVIAIMCAKFAEHSGIAVYSITLRWCIEIWRISHKALCKTAIFNMPDGAQPATRWFVSSANYWILRTHSIELAS